MLGGLKLLGLASGAALVVGLAAGVLVSVAGVLVSSIGEPNIGSNDWGMAAQLLVVFAAYNFALGLLPGLVAHALLLRMRLTGLAPYLVAATLIGSGWCIFMRLPVGLCAYVLTCALVGTATFWAIRRPDRAKATPGFAPTELA